MVDEPLRIACVSGVSRGLGVAIAAELLGRGWEVVGLGRSADPALAGKRFRLAVADLAHLNVLDAVAAATFADVAMRRPARAVLVNNAAVAGPTGLVGRLSADEIAVSLAINLAAPLILANAFVRALAGAVPARVVNLSSGAAASPLPGCVAYCVGKAGLEMIAPVIAAERPAGVEAVTIRPGIVDTPMQAYMRTREREALPIADVFQGFHASGSLQTPGETARRIVEHVVLADVPDGTLLSYRDLPP